MPLSRFRKGQNERRDKEIYRLYVKVGMSYEDIGKLKGLTRERIRQIIDQQKEKQKNNRFRA
ncbi:MAG TPA: sigma factor-like helix-turn-helix DNA-binding protein [Candidatus Saccharibacteria bacterium]|nr:sigma factor-like helix-turn-helix DNA-binding protein [Candidatus Saccharibacteria bacterium]